MKRILHTILLLMTFSLLSAQTFKVRECTEGEIPLSARGDYYKTVERYLDIYYQMLPSSIGNAENRDAIINNVMANRDGKTLKTEFLLENTKDLSFVSPMQYYVKFESVFSQMADDIEFVVDNVSPGKIMMNSLVSCFIPVDYDLTLMKGEDILFKRRCRMTFLFQKIAISSIAKTMQVEPLKEIFIIESPESKAVETENNISFIDKLIIKFKSWPIYDKILYSLILCFLVGGCIYSLIGVYCIYLEDLIHISRLIFKAKTGDIQAMKDLAVYYRDKHTKQSDKKSFEWYLKAAQNGDKEAMRRVAEFYKNGTKTLQSDKKAVEWYTKASVLGDEWAQYITGMYYLEGKGVEQSFEKAVEWFTKAAGQGHTEAQVELGLCYKNGLGIPQSFEKAVEWFTKAAEQGHSDAQYELGLCYHKGDGVPQSYVKAVEWLAKAAQKNNSNALFQLGEYYYKGIAGIAVDYIKAFNYYKKAAVKGNRNAYCQLGMCYKEGHGTDQSYENAFSMFFIAASHHKNTVAQYETGLCYLEGKGVEQSFEKAVEWFTKAAEQGHTEAQIQLDKLTDELNNKNKV